MAFQSPLISIPKKTTTDVDYTNPIRAIIAQSYGEDPKNYTEECAVLQRCRQDAVRGAGSDNTARDLIYKYFGQLELLELRFAEIKVSFPWNDAFTEKLTTQSSLAFEKASIIHLLSSVLSSLAATSSRADPEGVKRAYFNARAAGGMLNYINENFLHAPSTDLSREVVHFCGGVMMAQATEIFTEKLVEEKKAPSLVSRSANQAAGMYAALVEEMKDFQGKGILDRNWLHVIMIKAKLFASLGQYYRSTADASAGKHGAALVRMKLADASAQEASRLAASFVYTFVPSATPSLPSDSSTCLQEITKAHAQLCKEAKEQAMKDNDLIYHDILPSEASLPAIEKLPAAAPVTIQEIYANPDVSKLIGPDIFIRLVPLAVHESASVYSEEKAKLVRSEVERVDMSEGEIRAGLEHLGLPQAVSQWRALLESDQDGDAEVEISASLRHLAEDVQRGGSVEASIRDLDAEREKAERELRELTSSLDNESRDCERMRSKYNPQFTQSPSGPHTAHFRSNISSNLGSLQAAASSDSSVLSLWREIQGPVSALSGGASGLRRAAQEVATSRQPRPEDRGISLLDLQDDEPSRSGLEQKEKEELGSAVKDASDRLDRLGKVRRERDEVLKDLKDKIQNDDVSNLLLLNRRNQNVEPQLFATELEKFRPYQSRIASAVTACQSILQELEMLVRQVETGKGMKERSRTSRDRNRRLREWERSLESAGEQYSEVRAGLGKGLSFYESLGIVIAELRSEVKGFISTRDNERNRMVAEIETRQRISSGGSPPPPPSSISGAGSIESRLAALSVGGAGPGSPSAYGRQASPYAASQASPNVPAPSRPVGAHAASTPGLPPPPPPAQPATPNYPPPPPASSSRASNPYDFGSLSSLPSAFQTSTSPPPAPAPTRSSQPAYPSHLPPQPSTQTSYDSYGSAQQQSTYGYSSPPTQQHQSPYAAPPSTSPQSSYGYRPSSGSAYPPSSNPPSHPSTTSYYPPPPPQHPPSRSYASPPPQPPAPQQHVYPSHPPPSQSAYPAYAPPGPQTYPAGPPPSHTHQQQQLYQQPSSGGYGGYTSPPPQAPLGQGYGQGYQYR